MRYRRRLRVCIVGRQTPSALAHAAGEEE